MDEIVDLEIGYELNIQEQFVKMILGATAAFIAGKLTENVVESVIKNRHYKTK